MISRLARHPAYSRLGAAAVLAAAALLGTTTGTLGNPATACAAPTFDRDGYGRCTGHSMDAYLRDEITWDEMMDEFEECCGHWGGEWVMNSAGGTCEDPAAEDPAQLPRFPQLGEATATATLEPAPPAGPIAPLPPGQATLAPAPPPAGPTTSLPIVPPAQTG